VVLLFEASTSSDLRERESFFSGLIDALENKTKQNGTTSCFYQASGLVNNSNFPIDGLVRRNQRVVDKQSGN